MHVQSGEMHDLKPCGSSGEKVKCLGISSWIIHFWLFNDHHDRTTSNRQKRDPDQSDFAWDFTANLFQFSIKNALLKLACGLRRNDDYAAINIVINELVGSSKGESIH